MASPIQSCSTQTWPQSSDSNGSVKTFTEVLSEWKKPQSPDPNNHQSANKFHWKNMYPDILPNEATRVYAGDEARYYNGNHVLGTVEDPKSGRAIAAQGPTHQCIRCFLELAWDHESPAIITVANDTERGRMKFVRFWPRRPGATKNFYGIQVTLEEEETLFQLEDHPIVKRTLILERDEKQRRIVQYHLIDWPDRGVLSSKVLAAFVQKVYEELHEEKQPFICHCSAGCGRTGTFLAAYHLYRLFKEEEAPADVPVTIESLRSPETGRCSIMVQTQEQYLLIYQTLAELKVISLQD